MDPRLERSWLLIEARRYQEALDLLMQVLADDPESPFALHQAAICGLMLEDLAVADEMAGKLVAQDPDSEHGHALLALVASRKDQPARAEQHLLAAIERNPNEAEHQARYAYFLLGRERIEDGITVAWRGLKLDPESVFVRKVLQQLYLANDELDLARKMGDEALQRDPNDADVHYSIAQVALAGGRTASARGSFRESLRLNPQLASGDGLLDIAHDRVRHWWFYRPGMLMPTEPSYMVIALVVTPLFWAGLAWLWSPLWYLFCFAVTVIVLAYLYTASFFVSRWFVLRGLQRGRT